mmetsp:Transcript_4579/g.11765  ORF Transcript_4579/g.11765 Transcript_4579/m.11765 type:complete len:208 (+) Transcript_4579:205-828(+)
MLVEPCSALRMSISHTSGRDARISRMCFTVSRTIWPSVSMCAEKWREVPRITSVAPSMLPARLREAREKSVASPVLVRRARHWMASPSSKNMTSVATTTSFACKTTNWAGTNSTTPNDLNSSSNFERSSGTLTAPAHSQPPASSTRSSADLDSGWECSPSGAVTDSSCSSGGGSSLRSCAPWNIGLLRRCPSPPNACKLSTESLAIW